MDSNLQLQLMAGIDIPCGELQLTIHSPKIREIAFIGESRFFQALQYICLDKQSLTQDKTLLENLSNFQILMEVLKQSKDSNKKNSILDLFLILFPNYKTTITTNSIILMETKDNKNIKIIDNDNFNILQNFLKDILCLSSLFQGDNIIYNPADDKAKEIAQKLMKNREKVAAKKLEKSGSFLSRYLSILTIGINSMSLNDLLDLTLFQLFDLLERYNLFVSWENYFRISLVAGSKERQEPENWMKDLH